MKTAKDKAKSDEEWIASAATRKILRCCICHDKAAPYIRSLVEQIHEKKAFRITCQDIWQRVTLKYPKLGEKTSAYNFRLHLNHHEPKWAHYKGEKP